MGDKINTEQLKSLGAFKSRGDISELVKDMGLRNWLLGFGEKLNTASVCYRNFRSFYNWLQSPENVEHTDLKGKTPDELARLQWDLNASTGYGSGAQRRAISEALLHYLESNKEWRARYKAKIHSSVKSFFEFHTEDNGGFPKLKNGDKTRLKGEAKTGKELQLEELKLIIDGSNPCYKALFSCMLASGMGLGEALEWSDQGIGELEKALANPVRHDPKLIEVHLGARKHNVDEDFYVYLGGSALTYLEAWLKHRKTLEARPNAPKPFPKSVFVGNTYNPLKASAVEFYWLAQLRDLGLYEKRNTRTNRTNRNIHQIRSIYRTRAGRAVSTEAESKTVEYFMGHKPDALDYDRIQDDRRFRISTYLKILRYLDTQEAEPGAIEIRLKSQIDDLTRQVDSLQTKLDKALKYRPGDVKPKDVAERIEVIRERGLEGVPIMNSWAVKNLTQEELKEIADMLGPYMQRGFEAERERWKKEGLLKE